MTGIEIKDQSDALRAMEKLHEMGVAVGTVLFSSTELASGHLVALASTTEKYGTRTAFSIEIPKLPASFIGTGEYTLA